VKIKIRGNTNKQCKKEKSNQKEDKSYKNGKMSNSRRNKNKASRP
jgi:hypothetical protein